MKGLQILGANLDPDYEVETYPKKDAEFKKIENALMSCANSFIYKEFLYICDKEYSMTTSYTLYMYISSDDDNLQSMYMNKVTSHNTHVNNEYCAHEEKYFLGTYGFSNFELILLV